MKRSGAINFKDNGCDHRARHRGAFIMADILVGLSIVVGLIVILTVAATKQKVAEQKLADQRCANRLAEHAMLNLQHHQGLPAVPKRATVSARLVPAAGSDSVPAGRVWGAVDATVAGRRATLLGMVPADAIAPASPGTNQSGASGGGAP